MKDNESQRADYLIDAEYALRKAGLVVMSETVRSELDSIFKDMEESNEN